MSLWHSIRSTANTRVLAQQLQVHMELAGGRPEQWKRFKEEP